MYEHSSNWILPYVAEGKTMKIFLDTADLGQIEEVLKSRGHAGWRNDQPDACVKNRRHDPKTLYPEICRLVAGPVSSGDDQSGR